MATAIKTILGGHAHMSYVVMATPNNSKGINRHTLDNEALTQFAPPTIREEKKHLIT